MENEYLRVVVDQHGRLVSLLHLATGRESISPGSQGNLFRLFEDVPLYWDAWDVEVYHLEKGFEAPPGSVRIKESGPLRCVLEVTVQLSATSRLTQDIILTATSKLVEFDTRVDWNENRMILKVEFPVDVMSDVATVRVITALCDTAV